MHKSTEIRLHKLYNPTGKKEKTKIIFSFILWWPKRDFAVNARQNGFGALICAAGMAAHLAGAIAANTTLPVVGIPCKGGMMDGLDALLATVQMPTGIPVATIAINGAANAALLCAQIIAVEDKELAAKLDAKRQADAAKVLEKDRTIAANL